MKPKNKTRFCTPFSIKCLKCGTFTYKNKRHNSRQEEIKGEDFCGIPVYRFTFKCTGCFALLSIRTDPKNGQYLADKNCIKVDSAHKTQSEKSETTEDKNFEQLQNNVKKLYEIEKRMM